MGFAVVQINGRGAWGFGIKHREAIKAGYEETQIEDILETVDRLAKRYRINPNRVALVGENHGGFVALRALQLHPERFRCAVAINAPVDLVGWIEETRWTSRSAAPALTRAYLGDPERLKAAPLVHHPELIRKPVFLLSYRGSAGRARSFSYMEARTLASALRSHDTPVEFLDLDDDYMMQRPRAKAAVFRRLENFLNEHVYDYNVKLGELQVMKD